MNSKLKYVLPVLFSFVCLSEASSAIVTTDVSTFNNLRQKGATLKVVSPFVLQTSEVSGYSKVVAGETIYYFDASKDKLAQILSGTPAGNLIETDKQNATFKYGETYYAFDINALPVSSFDFVEGSISDYNFMDKELNASNNIENKYYKIVFKTPELTNSEQISWTEVGVSGSDTITVQLPNGQLKYFKYTYTPEIGKVIINTHQTGLTGDVNATFVDSSLIKTGTAGVGDCDGDLACGGAIYNSPIGNIEKITGDFVNNYVSSDVSSFGGAIWNYRGNIGEIDGSFVGNYTTGAASEGFGGALGNNLGIIGNITGDFVANRAKHSGGAISNNEGKIGYITGNFVGNTSQQLGGAIWNNSNSQIGNITGNFVGNSAGVGGGAISNNSNSQIGNITGNFVGNSAGFGGGAIWNNSNSQIGNITGDFIGNTSQQFGGAIWNASSIGDITGNFVGNYSNYDGGAIWNISSIGDITGNFVGNYSANYGGVLWNYRANVGNIAGDFIDNHAKIAGGAIYNMSGTIKNIAGNFSQNYASGESAFGGALSNQSSSKIDLISGSFYENYVLSTTSDAQGGAIYNFAFSTVNVIGDFIGNYAKSVDGIAYGGALSNYGGTKIETLTGKFLKNLVSSENSTAMGGAISNRGDTEVVDISGDFIENAAISMNDSAKGGAISIEWNGVIDNISGNFTKNYVRAANDAKGGAVYVVYSSKIKNVTGDFIGNYVSSKGENAHGGAIYIDSDSSLDLSTSQAKKNILIENNKTIAYAGLVNQKTMLNSINLAYSNATLNLNTITGSSINIRDAITSYSPSGNLGAYGEINKTGSGVLYLWGDNSEYYGDLNILGGTFYAMYDDVQDKVNDASGQRMKFDMSNAVVHFADGTVFRPKVSSTQIANIGNSVSVTGVSQLRPYNVSSLNSGTHSYNVDYSMFEGFESDLLKVESQGGKTNVVIKQDLAGYNGLTSFADVYRKRQNLSQTDREMYDNIYYNGKVENSEKEVLNTISGEDTRAFQELHKASVRQFNRQIYSRIQNKDCPSCGMLDGFSDEHLWFNIGQNWIEKESRGSVLGYDYSPTSLAFGYDYDVIPNALTLGVAISYAYGDVKGKGGSTIYSRSEVDEYLASMYWKYKPMRAYTTGSIGGGVIQNKTKLATDSVNTRGEYDTNVLFSNIEVGYDFGNACYVFEPFVGVDYSYMVAEAYNEKGEGARHFDKNNYNTLELPIGFRISRNMLWDSFIFTPAFELAYARNVGDRNISVNSYFVGAPESSWAAVGNPDDRDSIRSKLNLKVNNIYIPFAFNFGYARDTRAHYTDDQLYLTVRYNF